MVCLEQNGYTIMNYASSISSEILPVQKQQLKSQQKAQKILYMLQYALNITPLPIVTEIHDEVQWVPKGAMLIPVIKMKLLSAVMDGHQMLQNMMFIPMWCVECHETYKHQNRSEILIRPWGLCEGKGCDSEGCHIVFPMVVS